MADRVWKEFKPWVIWPSDQLSLNEFFDSIIPSMRTSKIQNDRQGAPRWLSDIFPLNYIFILLLKNIFIIKNIFKGNFYFEYQYEQLIFEPNKRIVWLLLLQISDLFHWVLYFQPSQYSNKIKYKLGLSWAKLSSSWDWT